MGRAAIAVRLLLDTHVIVWAAADVERLDARVANLLTDSRNELWISAVSAWELALLAERGRLTLLPDTSRWLESAVAGLGLHEAPLTAAIALESRHLAVSTEDPANRFIAATARPRLHARDRRRGAPPHSGSTRGVLPPGAPPPRVTWCDAGRVVGCHHGSGTLAKPRTWFRTPCSRHSGISNISSLITRAPCRRTSAADLAESHSRRVAPRRSETRPDAS